MTRGGRHPGRGGARSALLGPAFVLLWASETAFDLGTAMMAFALGVWIFQRTGSAEQFTGAVLASALPALVVAPVAGALADRVDRRWVIAGCDLVSLAMITCLALLVAQDRLATAGLYAFNAAIAVAGAVRTPAYRAAFSAVVPASRLSQAAGLLGVTQSLLQSGAPLIAGYVMGATTAGLAGVVAIDAVVLAGAAIAAFGALSRARDAIAGVRDGGGGASLIAGVAASFASAVQFVRRAPGMAVLAWYGALQEALVMLATSMLTPLVLSTQTSDELGVILSCGGLGALVGSLLLVALRVTRRLMIWVLVCDACLAACVMLAGFATSTLGWCVCAFFALLVGAASTACAGALWMGRTPAARRGGVFALIAAANLAAACGALWAGGLIGARVFEPALADGGAWSGSIGSWLGTGPGHGLRLLFIVCGAASCVVSLIGLSRGRLRRLDELPAPGGVGDPGIGIIEESLSARPAVELVATDGRQRTDRSRS